MLIYVSLYILIYHTLHSPLSYAKIVTGYAFYTLCKFLLGACYSLSTVLRYSGKSDPTMFQCIFFSITVNQTSCSYLCLSGDSAPGCCLSATYLCPSILQQALTRVPQHIKTINIFLIIQVMHGNMHTVKQTTQQYME